jgi:hypothetical protein
LIDEELVKLSSNIEDVEAEIKASTDPDEKKLLRNKEYLHFFFCTVRTVSDGVEL